MEIKKITSLDVELLAPLFDAYRVFYEQESDLASARKYIEERLTNNESIIFMAKNSQEEVIGFTQLYPSFSSISLQRTWILNDLYVLESERGNGVGRMLIQAATEFARGTGAKGLSLETAHDNYNAQGLYESQGFVRDSEFYSYFLTL